MKQARLSAGKGKTRVSLFADWMGQDLIVYLFNDQAHLGAVAVADFSDKENRASTSVITRLGHKEDSVARSAAHTLSRQLKRPVCVIAGIHVDAATQSEIDEMVKNCDLLVKRLGLKLAGAAGPDCH